MSIEYTHNDLLKFAPSVYLHPDEQFGPDSVENYLSEAELWEINKATGHHERISNQLTPELIGEHPNTDTKSYYLKTRNGSPSNLNYSVYRGGLSNGQVHAPMYVNVLEGEKGGYVDLQYIFFFPFNGPQFFRAGIVTPIKVWDMKKKRTFWIDQFGEKEGDWEHITVRVTADFSDIIGVYYDRHGANYSEWLLKKDVPLENNTHPVVFSACHSHGSFQFEDEGFNLESLNHEAAMMEGGFGGLVALTSFFLPILTLPAMILMSIKSYISWFHVVDVMKRGPAWKPWESGSDSPLVELKEDTPWLKFTGRWGPEWTNKDICDTHPHLPGHAHIQLIQSLKLVKDKLSDQLSSVGSSSLRDKSWFTNGDAVALPFPEMLVNDGKIMLPLYCRWSGDRRDSRVQVGSKFEGMYDGYETHLGYVFKDQQPGTVPLYSKWSSSRKDTRTQVGTNFESMYNGHMELLGYIYESAQTGTVPLYSKWSSSRSDTRTQIGDNFESMYNGSMSLLGHIPALYPPEMIQGDASITRLNEIYSKWSSSRSDTRTQVGSNFEGYYNGHMVRLGYSLKNPAPDTVHIFNRWSGSRNDTRTQAGSQFESMYSGHMSDMGYIFAHERPGTREVFAKWSGSRRDTRTQIGDQFESMYNGSMSKVGYIPDYDPFYDKRKILRPLFSRFSSDRADTRTQIGYNFETMYAGGMVYVGYVSLYKLPGMVPLYSRWSGSRSDTRTQVGDQFEGMYDGHMAFLGYIYEDEMPGTVPLFSRWSGDRCDTRTQVGNQFESMYDGHMVKLGYVLRPELFIAK